MSTEPAERPTKRYFPVHPPLIVLLLLLASFVTTTSRAAGLDEGSETCLTCHGSPGMVMTLGDGTSVPVTVDGTRFGRSVHANLGCSGCHSVSLDNHPSARYTSKKQFLAQQSGPCRNCHSDDQLKSNLLHKEIVSGKGAPACSQCHRAHEIIKVAKRKDRLGLSQYCLTCHSKPITRSIGGEQLSLMLEEDWIKGSVHRNHECNDCHAAYSKGNHPPPTSAPSIRTLSLEIAETCKTCHLQMAVQYSDSIHSRLSRQGNEKAPVCTDCHGSHKVGPAALADTLDGMPCKNCHEREFAAYRTSVHGMRRESGAQHPPLCAGCHSAHDVKPALASRSPRAMCLECHLALKQSHAEWLPNPEAHLEMVACTACHVNLGDKRTIYLRIIDDGTGKLLSGQEVRKRLEVRGIGDRPIEPQELWWLFQRLNGERRTNIAVAVGLDEARHAHDIMARDSALRSCEGCHSTASSFFDTVSIATAGPDGRESFLQASPKVLTSAYGMLLLRRFYVMSGTRVTAMDYAGIAIILGGIAVPLLHGTARFLTRGWRKKSR